VLLLLALPGSAYLYQGEELGLFEVEDIPDDLRQDPMFHQGDGENLGRDGCRVPLPWSGETPPFGFSPAGATKAPWLPQPAEWRGYTVEREQTDPDSMLALYRRALRLRRAEVGLGDGPLRWLPAQPDVLAFARGDGFACVVNLSTRAVPLPPHRDLILASAPVHDGLLPPDSSAWLRTA
jgi:alpha-glucosidase